MIRVAHAGRRDAFGGLARWVLGGAFIYMGMTKALHPAEFLKVTRQYAIFENHVFLNFTAATLPWFEVFCGALLIVGIAVRGSALALVALLVPFSWLVFSRAWAVHQNLDIAFCAVRFDCGCGAGEVAICGKLVENALLLVLTIVVLCRNIQLKTLTSADGPNN